jgi:hypothetical protein
VLGSDLTALLCALFRVAGDADMAPTAEETHLDHDTDEPAQAAAPSPEGSPNSPKGKKQHHSKYEHANSGEDHGLHRKARRKKQT